MLASLILSHIFDNMKDKHKYGTVEQWRKLAPEQARYKLALAKGSGRFVVSQDDQKFFYKAGDLRISLDIDNAKDTEIETVVRKIADLILSGSMDRARFTGQPLSID